MDAWELLTANAADTTDAWAALGSQQTTSGIPGSAVDEIPFTVGDVVQLSATISPSTVLGTLSLVTTSASLQPTALSSTLVTESIPITEGC